MNQVSFLKRMLVISYDALLLVGVTLVGYGVLYALMSVFPSSFEHSIASKAIKVVYLLVATFVFYGWFWTHGGQTLGMKVWNLYLITDDGKFISWSRALLRYVTALLSWLGLAGVLFFVGIERWYLALGLGFTWSIIDTRQFTWHDILSASKIVQQPKGKK